MVRAVDFFDSIFSKAFYFLIPGTPFPIVYEGVSFRAPTKPEMAPLKINDGFTSVVVPPPLQ